MKLAQAGRTARKGTARKRLRLSIRMHYYTRLFTLPLLFTVCTLFYYFGELASWAGWQVLQLTFFYSIHDVHRLLFLGPIIYAGYHARVKGAVLLTLVSLVVFLPRALFISPYPDPLLRMLLFVAVAGTIGTLTGMIRNKEDRFRRSP